MKPTQLSLLLFLLFSSSLQAKVVESFESEGMKVTVEEIASLNGVIWGFDFISPDEMILSQREGQILLLELKNSSHQKVAGVPKVRAKGQGGMLDIHLHPNFAKTRWVYFCYSHPTENGATTRMSRAKLKSNVLEELEVLFTARPASNAGNHFGCRIAFDRKGHVFLSIGDRTDRDAAQDLSRHNGSIIRLKENGELPPDNPFMGKPKALPEIWTYGHRNPQGLKFDQQTQELWSNEHGPRGGDEINLIQKAKNYGWPILTYGREYHGPKIGEGVSKPGFEAPVKHFTPSIAPSSLEIYRGKQLPAWQGHFFSGALALTHLNRTVIQNSKALKEERLLTSLRERIRQVRQGPDDYLYLSTDSGKILRLRPSP